MEKGGAGMGKNGRKSCRRWLLPAALVLAGAAWFENFTLSSSTVEVRSAALPAAFSGLRVVQISDLHGRRFDAGSRYLLALVRLQNPDIIALTGDLADEFTDVSMLPPLLEGLTALAPTFYVTGNHEWVLSREKRQALFDLLVPLVVASILVIILKLIYFDIHEVIISVASGLGMFTLMLLIEKIGTVILKKDSLGGGDIKFSFLIGLILNFKLGVVALILSTFLAFPYAVASLKVIKSHEFPYGPFLAGALFIVFFQSKQV